MEDVDLMNESLDDDVDLMNEELGMDEYILEMGRIISVNEPIPIRIDANPDTHRIGNPYFKVYNSTNPSKATKIARLHYLDEEREYHKDRYDEWDLNNKEIKIIKDILSAQNPNFTPYSNWDICKWIWNYEYFPEFTRAMMKEYMDGDLDEEYKDEPSYVPLDLDIPDTWVYKPPKK